MSKLQRGKKDLRKELATYKGKLRSQGQSVEKFKVHVLRMVDYADGVARKIKELEGIAELAKGYLTDFGDHKENCALAPGVDCDCGYQDGLNALDEASAARNELPPGVQPVEPKFDAVAWAKAEAAKAAA